MILKKIELKTPWIVCKAPHQMMQGDALLRGGGIIIFFSFLLPLVLLFFLLPQKIFAQVVINEVFPNPSGSISEPNEFIELFNVGADPVTITGWKISDISGSVKTYILPETTLNPGIYISLRREVTGIALNNEGGDGVELRDSEGDLKDSMSFDSTIDDRSWSRIPNGTGEFVNNTEPTEGRENNAPPTPTLEPTLTPAPTEIPPTATPTPTATPAPSSYDNIFISEFMADPESGDEWVELYNDNDGEVNLIDWHIGDLVGSGNSPRSISGTISGNSYRQFFIGDSFLNNGNSGDDVRLIDGSQTQKDQKSYSSATKGKSWSKDNDSNWCQADPTPNSANPICSTATSAPLATVTPTSVSTPTPTKKPTATPRLSPTPTEIETNITLAGGTSGNPAILGAQTSPTQSPVKNGGLGKFKITAGLFIFSGLVLLGMAGFFFYREGKSKI